MWKIFVPNEDMYLRNVYKIKYNFYAPNNCPCYKHEISCMWHYVHKKNITRENVRKTSNPSPTSDHLI